MFSISKLRKLAENLESDTGLHLTAASEITVVLENGQRIDIPRELAARIFGSVENFTKVKEAFTGTESLEIHNVKRIDDDIWLLLEDYFSMVDEV